MRGPLPFLDRQAVTLTQADAVVQRIADQLPLRGLVQAGSASKLRMRSVVVPLGAMAVAGTAHSALQLEMAPLPDVVTLAFCEAGSADLSADGHRVLLPPCSAAMFLPGCAFHCTTAGIVSVLLHDSAQRLAAAATAMVAPEARENPGLQARFNRPLVLDGSGDARLQATLTSLRRALRLLDEPQLQASGGFEALQLEDLLRRHLVLLLWPDLIDPEPPPPMGPWRDPILEALLEWMDCHLDAPLTLTALALRSGDSVRNLQYRFQRRLGCSPMQWLRQRRLEAVHAELSRGEPGGTVAAIARRHGFHHLPTFSAAFQRRFGILPSQLLRQGKRT
ncbi:transcriptional regulator, AraC family protein [Cyanobium sp. PCC 7001]|uniref:helix-turn-helix transcriptional regulator n=1 Tax=Cyanobium sp. PCC 7001 TaxID=180281 RepID=UPI0001804B47|nr:helix-turn-helix transcriptional regulator [Cyanobium sp. PCC 7001]EDY38485.1 transcriptional regulator, AraC family protein [Cyanobium sp. PCC 7001]